MKSLAYVLKNKKLPFILLFEEMVLFMFTFCVVFLMMDSVVGNSFPDGFSLAMVYSFFMDGGFMGVMAGVVPLLLLFLMIHLFLMSGVFSGLDIPLNRFGDFLKKSAEGFWRFFFLMLFYLILGLIVSGLTNKIISAMQDRVYNTLGSGVLIILKPVLLSIMMIFLSYFHTKSRFSVVKFGRMSLFNRFSFSEFITFFLYQIFSLVWLILFGWISIKWLSGNGWMLILAVFLFQVGVFLRIVFQLASYKSLDNEF